MKMPNGSGSVYKLSDTKRRRPWVAAVSCGYNSKGRVKRMVIGYYKSQPEARAALQDYQKHPTDKLNITLGEVYKEWSDVHFQTVSHHAEKVYRVAWPKLSALEDERVRNIRTAQLQAVIDGNSHLGYSALSKIKVLMNQLLKYAAQNDIIDRNYAEFVKLPKAEKSVKDAFTDIELSKIKSAIGTVPYADWVLILCYTGFRIGEFLALTPFSYDAKYETLTGGSKTEAGRNRTIPIHPLILPAVKDWLSRGGDTIFCQEDGKAYKYHWFLLSVWTPVLEAIGVRYLSPHSTRHTFATLLNKGGANTADAQKLIGHANYSTTADIYTHQDVQTLRSAIEKIEIC